MKKHIRLKHGTERNGLVAVTIEEQSHTCHDFGIGGSKSFEAKNGITLISESVPAFSHHDCKIKFWVRGVTPNVNNVQVMIPGDYYDRVIAAVKEYNEYFSDENCERDVRESEVFNVITRLSQKNRAVATHIEKLNDEMKELRERIECLREKESEISDLTVRIKRL